MTEETKIAELLKPRYKIIDDYPGLKIPVGAILIPNRLDGTINNEWVTPDKSDRKNLYGYDLSKYPHLFKKLEWWHERTPDELPKYIGAKNEGGVFNWICPIVKYLQTGLNEQGLCLISYTTLEGEYVERDIGLWSLNPATSAEYTSYLTSK
jgi:hypothetical protein